MRVQAAWAASRTKGTYLGSKYRKMASRMGKKKAWIALAHPMLVSIDHMIQKKEPYKELGADYLENLYKERTVKNLKKRMESLGYSVELKMGQSEIIKKILSYFFPKKVEKFWRRSKENPAN